MIQFYCPDIETNAILPESDSAHAVRVLRLKEGALLQVIDGRGHAFDCVLTAANPKRAAVEIVARRDMPLPWSEHITVAVAPTKMNDRMEWLVEKLTEVGINRIVPMLCEHSERKEIKVERLEKIAIAAMKQSLKAVLPQITPMMPIAEVLKRYAEVPQAFMGYCDDATPRVNLACALKPRTDTLLLIGPEGDFSPREVSLAIEHYGVRPVTLGDNRLRTETAALAGVHTIHVVDSMASCGA